MLILERCKGEKVNIGDDIEIIVTHINNWGKPAVKLGITAPKHITIDRNEVYERKKLGLEPPPKACNSLSNPLELPGNNKIYFV